MERYLDGQELSPEEVASALKSAVTRGELFPVMCGVATKNLGTTAVLDLLVEGVPSPAKKGSPIEVEGATSAVFIFKTVADPFSGRINVFRVLKGTISSDATLANVRTHGKERVGALLTLQGKDHESADEFGEGDLGAAAKLKDVMTGDLLLDADQHIELPSLDFPEPVMSFAITPKAKGDEEKVGTSLRRLAEEDPTLSLRRDPQTGEQLLSGMSQMHVEVAVDRLKSRFGVDVDLHQPRVPYLETIRKEARARHRYKKQTGGRGQFGDAEIVIEPLPEREGYEFVDEIVGGVIAQGFRPAVDKGIQEAMQHGELAGAPVQGVRVRLVDGQQHQVDSSEMAFKIAGSMAFKEAYQKADPVLLEPIMEVEVSVPDDSVGAINGDLNSRRGRLQGMEPRGGMTSIKAEVPMAEILTYAQALTSLTGGRGDYHMHFLRTVSSPPQKVIANRRRAQEAKVWAQNKVLPCVSRRRLSCRAHVCDLRGALGRRALGALLAERRRLRRRLPAVPGDRARPRLAEGGQPDHAGRRGPPPKAARGTGRVVRVTQAAGRARRGRTDSAPALGAREGDGRRHRALQQQRVPAYGRRDCEELGRAACQRRAALGRQRRGGDHVAWDLVVPVPRHRSRAVVRRRAGPRAARAGGMFTTGPA
jgi:elongation factor G